MVSSVDSQELTLQFVDTHDPGAHVAPAGALAQSVEALQRLVNLLAMLHEGRTPGKRMRPSVDLQRRYRLVCELPQPGSYQLPVRLDGAALLGPSDADRVMKQLTAVLAAGSAGDAGAFEAAVPDSTWQRFLLDAMERLPPHPQFGVNLTIAQFDKPVCDTTQLRGFTERLLRAPTNSERSALVGRLTEIDFEKHTVTLRHRDSKQALSCSYSEAVELSLLEHPREDVVVFGIMTRGVEGHIKSIDQVDHIEPVDLSPFEIRQIPLKSGFLLAKEALSVDVDFDEDAVMYEIEYPQLTISTFGNTRAALEEAFLAEIAMLWGRFALADDSALTRTAQALKSRLLSSFEEAPNAA
jgi:hypothetical protein